MSLETMVFYFALYKGLELVWDIVLVAGKEPIPKHPK
jgi:hypothetical protein